MKIALIGYGKMGKAIEAVALQQGHSIVLTIDQDNAADLTAENLLRADVAIEFTGPDSAFRNIMTCLESGIPLVCGSTGWLAGMDAVKDYCRHRNATFLYASNFSIGVNLFFEINKRLASLMNGHPEYDIGLEETHHTQKKDAPSGTAVTLAEQVLEKIDRKTEWINVATTDKNQLPIVSHRTDPAPGTHIVTYSSPVDSISISHTAHSRLGFAWGAVVAAAFIKDKKGIFSMQDVLGL